jgi:hypothetical protein
VHARPRPTFRAATTVRFADFLRATQTVRSIAQGGLYPANCRLLDPLEALGSAAGDGTHAVLILTFESADHPVDAWLDRALKVCADDGGASEAPQTDTSAPSASGQGVGHESAGRAADEGEGRHMRRKPRGLIRAQHWRERLVPAMRQRHAERRAPLGLARR